MSSMKETAAKFFEACETGSGWAIVSGEKEGWVCLRGTLPG